MKTKPAEDPDEIVELTRLGETADPKRVNKARDKDKLAELQLGADLLAVMNTKAGRRVVAAILAQCGVGDIALREDDRMTAFALGSQNTGHWLVYHLRKHCLDLMRLMEDEDHDGTSN